MNQNTENTTDVNETQESVVEKQSKKRGPKSMWERPGAVEKILQSIHAGAAQEGENMPSRWVEKQLAEAGLVEFKSVASGKPGRPALMAYVTPRGLAKIGSPE